MKTLYLMLFKAIVPVFFITLLFFVMIFQFIDLFSNLWNYIKFEVPLPDIGYAALLYAPKCVSWSVPIALLFTVSFVLGIMYANSEMMALFGSGISLYSFVLPLLILGAVMSAGMYFFEENVVIDAFKYKNDFTRKIFKRTENYSRENVTISSPDNSLVYHANLYDDAKERLFEVTIVEKDDRGRVVLRLDAESGVWEKGQWVLYRCHLFRFDGGKTVKTSADNYTSPAYNQKPELFRNITRKVEELREREAREYIESLKKAYLPYQESLSEYYKKFSFPFIVFIVVLISSAMGSFFQRNVVLISLLVSLGIVIAYYVLQMITMTLARNGIISPAAGAWLPFLVFMTGGIVLFRSSHT